MTFSTSFQFSATHGTADQLEQFRETFGRQILKISIDPLAGADLQVAMTLNAFADVAIARGTLSPMRNRHDGSEDENDDVVLVLMRQGAGCLAQGTVESDISSGQAVQTFGGETAVFSGHTETRVTNLRLRRDLLKAYGLSPADSHRGTLRPTAALRLLFDYCEQLVPLIDGENPQLQRAITSHLHELAAVAINAHEPRKHDDHRAGVRAARLAAIKADILSNCTDGKLALGEIAGRHGISPRYVRALFEQEETSFTDFLVECRLQSAKKVISDPLQDHVSVSTVAYAAGFNDLSYFNRTFKRRFGLRPSDIRARRR